MLVALIMAGGQGTRFWPLSTEDKPKQFLNLIGNETMIQMTVNRMRPIIPIERIFVCTGKRYVDLVKEQVPELPERNIIIEPEARNTAPCIALSSMIVERYYKNATMIVLPSDHLISDEDKFRRIIREGNDYLNDNENAILTLGMKPNRAETGYGYIKLGEKVNSAISKVDRFVEKPNRELAEEYLELGNYLWNGGMFIWKINNIINKIKEYIPNTYEALHSIREVPEDKLQDIIDERYSRTDQISIDYAVLEKSNEIYVLPSEIGWDDIGSWKAVERYRKKDNSGNISSNNTIKIESEDNMIINNHKKVVMIGVKDILTIELEDRIFVINKNYIDNLREYKNLVQ